ncbi:MAG TPA: tetratricopeptide repeat protein [Acidimicrobiales bacterium]|nr:tetratricopeptide repeat protein [Acidimicrobiales bacterium]
MEVPRQRRPPKVPEVVGEELQTTAGARKAPHLARRLGDATKAYERDRYEDARRILKQLAADVPASPAVRELYGLTLYRQSRWRDALRELGAFHDLTGSYDQFPTMADASRALGRHDDVAELWEELRVASPSAELVTEGRIVAAGSRADQGDLSGAIRMLEGAARKVTRPRDHHLRLWYALADLYERAGEVPAARELFRRVLRHDRTFFDTAERLTALG